MARLSHSASGKLTMTQVGLDRSWTIPRPGETIAGKYVLEAERGRGGLAVVFSAIQIELDRRVAIKMLLPEWAADPEVVERFVREGRAATPIKSEHVAHVFDVGTLPSGAPYLVLEYLDGHNLDEVVRTWGPLPVPTAIDWLLQAAEAIAEAHRHGIVHRDLKPANLFLTQHADGTACIKVIDFGLSKVTRPRGPIDSLTRTTDVLGSPHYMAPEQLRSTRTVDQRADIWAIGVVLYELLAGKPPFGGSSVLEVCATVLTEPAAPLSSLRANVPPAVDHAILRCLQKDPDARFASIVDVARALSPYGTRLSRASFDRIERTLDATARLSDFSLLPPAPEGPEDPEGIDDGPWPAAHDGSAFRTPASARVVVGSFFMLSGLFIGALMWMYADVHAGERPAAHADERPAAGVTSMQPTVSTTAASSLATTAGLPPATATPPPPATPPPSATAILPPLAKAAPTMATRPIHPIAPRASAASTRAIGHRVGRSELPAGAGGDRDNPDAARGAATTPADDSIANPPGAPNATDALFDTRQ